MGSHAGADAQACRAEIKEEPNLTPREVLVTTAAEIGKHLRASRCMVAVGAPGEGAQATAEYAAPGFAAVGPQRISSIVGMVTQVTPDSMGGVELQAASLPSLRELGLESALGVICA